MPRGLQQHVFSNLFSKIFAKLQKNASPYKISKIPLGTIMWLQKIIPGVLISKFTPMYNTYYPLIIIIVPRRIFGNSTFGNSTPVQWLPKILPGTMITKNPPWYNDYQKSSWVHWLPKILLGTWLPKILLGTKIVPRGIFGKYITIIIIIYTLT